MREYYPYLFLLYGREYYCIWYSDEKDGFLVDSNRVITFQNKEQLYLYEKNNNLIFQDGIAALSIDTAVHWLEEESNYIDCQYFLDFWNIIGDLSYSVDENFYGNNDSDIINN